MTHLLQELRSLFWLQWTLTKAIFRSRRLADRAYILRLLLLVIQVVFAGPFFLALGVGTAILLASLSPAAAYEATLAINVFLMFAWLMLPTSYSSQIVERFEISRLFRYPVSFRAIVVGSAAISALSITGLWSLPILLGEIVGLAWHAPLSLPLILLGALPMFGLLTLTGRILEDLFDLVAGDRRLRGLALFLLSLPWMVLWGGQQLVRIFPSLLDHLPAPVQLSFERLAEAGSLGEFLTMLAPSRVLIWLPPGWASAGMSAGIAHSVWHALAYLILSGVAVGVLLGIHSWITRRLMWGATLSLGAERVRDRGRRLRLPGPPALSALFQKDLRYLRRNPISRRGILASLFMVVVVPLGLLQVEGPELSAQFRALLPMILGAGLIFLSNMTVNLSLLGNYFGSVDREGLGLLVQAPPERRYILLASNLAMLVIMLPFSMLVMAGFAWWAGDLSLVPLGLVWGSALQLVTAPVYHLAAILAPYRTQIQQGKQQGGNLGAFLAWLATGIPAALLGALLFIPYYRWPFSMFFVAPLALVVSAGFYWLTLSPLARLLMRREHRILDAVTRDF